MTHYEGDAVDLINERVRGCDDYDLLVGPASRFRLGYCDECLVQLRYRGTNMSRSEWPCLDFLVLADEFDARFPQYPKLIQLFRAIIQYTYGRYLMGRGEPGRARVEFQRAIQADLCLCRVPFAWLRALLPRGRSRRDHRERTS